MALYVSTTCKSSLEYNDEFTGRLKTRQWTKWHGRKCRGGKRGSKWQR